MNHKFTSIAPLEISTCGRQASMAAIALILIILMSSCSGKSGGENPADSASAPETSFHADADIAMSVRSIVDAIKVGEKLDSADYDFEGILTDGQGRPIYTDLQGNPGIWTIDVLSSTNAALRNVKAGDLLPDDLEEYIVGNLGLSRADLVATSEYDDDDETTVQIYDFGSGQIRFETRLSQSPNGTDAIFMNIGIRAAGS